MHCENLMLKGRKGPNTLDLVLQVGNDGSSAGRTVDELSIFIESNSSCFDPFFSLLRAVLLPDLIQPRSDSIRPLSGFK